jgi:hypothetical protein
MSRARRSEVHPEPEETTCPVTIRRAIAGKVEVGRCGMPLEESF